MTRNGTPDALADTRVELLVAEREAAHTMIGELVKAWLSIGGYLSQAHQQLIRDADAMRAEGKRT